MDTLVAADGLVARRVELRALGAPVAISICETTAGAAMLDDVRRWFARWERCLSGSSSTSELSRVNAAGGAPVRVSATLWSALHLALDAAAWTHGLVAPTEDWRAIRICDRTSRVTVPSDVHVDLGETAASWIADRAAARLSGCGAAWVDVGGALAIGGPRPNGEPWSIAVTDPARRDERLPLLRVARGGVATAESKNFSDSRGQELAATDVRSATVVGATAAEATVAARYLLLRGARHGLAWIETEPTLAAIVVREDGHVFESKRAASLLAA